MSTQDKANNTVQKAKGAVQENAGKVTGDKKLQSKGARNKAASDVKQAGEKIKDAVKR